MSEIASIVSTIGFPIASFLLSAYFIKYSYDKQLERDREKDEQESKHWEEISKLTSAVNHNTEVLCEYVKERENNE